MAKTNENSETESQTRRAQAKTWAFLWLFLFSVVCLFLKTNQLVAAPAEKAVVKEELSKEDKKSMAKQLIAEGDRQAEEKNYNLANATYESVFLLEPNNIEASQRIDRLKKRMFKEGRSETELVTRVYDQEIEERTRVYLKQAKELITQGKRAQARFTLQKLLLIDPLHVEANKLYKDLKEKSADASV